MNNDAKPAVSVIIPTYNRAKILPRAVNSVLKQTFTDFELIIVDDGSHDNTVEIIQKINDPRIIFIKHEQNKGVSATRNTGIKASRGNYIAFLDSDDEWFPNKLAIQVHEMKSGPPQLGVILCEIEKKMLDGRTLLLPQPLFTLEDDEIYQKALDDGLKNIGPQVMLVRRECFDVSGMFDEKISRLEDWDLAVRLSKHYRFHNVGQVLARKHETEDSLMSANEEKVIAAKLYLFRKFEADILNNKKLYAKNLYGVACFYCRTGRMAEGRKFLIQALWHAPYVLKMRYLLTFLCTLVGKNVYKTLRHLSKSIRT